MTKKILSLILLATLFVACGDDKDEYYNPVEGRWLGDYGDGDTETRVYNNKFEAYSILFWNGSESVKGHGSYTVDSKKVYYKTYEHVYRVENDSLWLKAPNAEKWGTKYVRIKE